MNDCNLSLISYTALMIVVLAAASNASGAWSWAITGYALVGFVCVWLLCLMKMTLVTWLLIAAPLFAVLVLLAISQAKWWAFELHHVSPDSTNLMPSPTDDTCCCNNMSEIDSQPTSACEQ